MEVDRLLIGPVSFGDSFTSIDSVSQLSLSDADNSVAVICMAEKDGTIDKLSIWIDQLTGNPPAYNFGVVTVDTSGRATTTAYGSSGIESVDFTATGLQTVTLATPATANAGDIFAIRIWPTGTAPDGSNFVRVVSYWPTYSNDDGFGRKRIPTVHHYGASWSTQNNVGIPNIGYRYSDGQWGGISASSLLSSNFSSASTPDEVGALFTVALQTKCFGCRVLFDSSTSSTTKFTVKLYDNSNTVLATQDVDIDLFNQNTGEFDIFWDSVTLDAGQNYRLTVFSDQTGFTENKIAQLTLTEAAQRSYFPQGLRWQLTTRTNSGSWTNTDTKLPMMGIYTHDVVADVSHPIIVKAWWGPGSRGLPAASVPNSSYVLDDADDSIALITVAEEDGTVDQVEVYCDALTGNPPAYTVGVFTLDTSGDPTTTEWTTGSSTTYDFTATGFHTITLPTAASVNAGDIYAVVIRPTGTAPDTSNKAQFFGGSNGISAIRGIPAVFSYSTAWSDISGATMPAFGHRLNNKWITAAWDPSYTDTLFNTASTPDEYGAKFSVPFSCKINGVLVTADFTAGAASTFDLTLYDAAGNVLASKSIDADINTNTGHNIVYFDPISLTADATYYLSLKNGGTVSTIALWRWVFNAANRKEAFPDGLRWSQVTRTDSGAWTEDQLKLPMMAIQLTEISAPLSTARRIPNIG